MESRLFLFELLSAREPFSIASFISNELRVRFMGSPHSLDAVHRDHEPRAWSADLQVGAFGARRAAPSWSSALLFMESLHDCDVVHWDHEPTPNPSQEGN